MTNPILLTLFSDGPLLENIRKKLNFEHARVVVHEFPDQETYLKVDADLNGHGENITPEQTSAMTALSPSLSPSLSPASGREERSESLCDFHVNDSQCVIVETLVHPNPKLLPLLFLSETLRDLGARQVGLLAPYLSYMRQDTRFHPGEAITSSYFAHLISHYFDWMVTVDPHLHRTKSLHEIYSIPTTVIHATAKIAHWIASTIDRPILIGPDVESVQWVDKIAQEAHAPFLILEKIRSGDNDVTITLPKLDAYTNYTPVLVDDIISTGKTMIKTIEHLKALNFAPPHCIGIHGIFAHSAYEDLIKAGAASVVTCNTISHPTNQIDLSAELADILKSYCQG
jgi:ribose-phosphate pyrophosphokinase